MTGQDLPEQFLSSPLIGSKADHFSDEVSHKLNEGFISNFCDGVNHCKDGSDEQFSQCLQVSPGWWVAVVVVVVVVVVVMVSGIIFIIIPIYYYT